MVLHCTEKKFKRCTINYFPLSPYGGLFKDLFLYMFGWFCLCVWNEIFCLLPKHVNAVFEISFSLLLMTSIFDCSLLEAGGTLH